MSLSPTMLHLSCIQQLAYVKVLFEGTPDLELFLTSNCAMQLNILFE